MPERLGFMMLSGCGYPHGTTGNRSEREINPLQVSDLEWLARTGQRRCLRLAGDKVNVIEGKKYWVLRKNRMILLCVLL